MSQRGVTLLELLLVMTIVAVIAAIGFPSVTSGIDSLRLRSATDSLVSFLNGAMSRAERRNEPVEVTIVRAENAIVVRSANPGYERRLDLPETIRITRILPENPAIQDERARAYVLYPGGAVPRFGVELANRRGLTHIIRVDPITGTPQVEP